MVYPTLENYIKKSGLNKTEIARRTGTPASTFYAKLAGESDNPRDKPRNERRKDPRDSYENVRGTRRLVRRAVRRL